MRRLAAILLASVMAAGVACTDASHYARATAILVDVSGTYADQKPEVVRIIQRGLLPKARPGDSLFLLRIDNQSYEKGNLEASVTLDPQPSKANAQKLRFARRLDAFAKARRASGHTDITGALMLAAEYLRETGAGEKTIVVFSDMKENLPKGVRRKLGPGELDGIRVVAMNVKKLARDNINPAIYRRRLAAWEKKLLAAGASGWQVVLDPEKLVETLYGSGY